MSGVAPVDSERAAAESVSGPQVAQSERSSAAGDGAGSEPKSILIVGDWVVDEYWHLVTHHSDISSHIGFEHYRSIPREQTKESEVFRMDLCGAGHVSRIIRTIAGSPDNKKDLKICGLGIWHPDDEGPIKQLLDGSGQCDLERAFLFPETSTEQSEIEIELVNLKPEDGQTTRVVRLYHKTGSGVEQLSRIDWEPPAKTLAEPRLTQLPDGLPDSVDAIILHDLRKGVVTDKLIMDLHEKYKCADWYVRSKQFKPPWLKVIGESLRLLLIGPEILNMMNPWHAWQDKNRLTYLGFNILDAMPRTSLVLVSDFREIIALIDQDDVLTSRGVPDADVDSLSQVGWSSAFFASLIYSMLYNQGGVTSEAIKDSIARANEHRSRLGWTKLESDPPRYKLKPDKWREEKEKWEQSGTLMGLLNEESYAVPRGERSVDGDGGSTSGRMARPEKGLALEAWRGCRALPGYVACIQEKVDVINQIGHYIRAFRGADSGRSVSILLQADPGTGKTFLAKRLAEVFKFRLVKWDITQMVQRSDLLNLFDSVATEQANHPKRPVLVFVDEINSVLAGNNVYGAFLAPLEEGAYVRQGNSFNLRPCVWIFAGTGLDSSSEGEKGVDFKSRMTMIAEFDFASLKRIRHDATLIDDARREQVYLGAFLIHQLYPDVTRVSRDILSVFYNLDPAEAPARIIRNLIMKVRDVQYGKITPRNCGTWGMERLEAEPLVELVFN